MPINRRSGKEFVEYSFNGILLNIKKKLTAIYPSRSKFQKHYGVFGKTYNYIKFKNKKIKKKHYGELKKKNLIPKNTYCIIWIYMVS